MRLVGKLIINALALFAAAALLPTYVHLSYQTASGKIEFRNIAAILGIAAVFGVVNTFLRPIVKLISLPLTLMTLGLFGFVINGAMLLLSAWIVGVVQSPAQPQFYALRLAEFPPTFSLDALIAAVLASIVISVVSTVLSWILP